MNRDLAHAIQLLNTTGKHCVLCKDTHIITGSANSMGTLLMLLNSQTETQDFYAADLVVGKSSAYLYVLLGVKAVYATIMSEAAIYTLARYGVYPRCSQSVPEIDDNMDSTVCAMDKIVNSIKDAHTALRVIQACNHNGLQL